MLQPDGAIQFYPNFDSIGHYTGRFTTAGLLLLEQAYGLKMVRGTVVDADQTWSLNTSQLTATSNSRNGTIKIVCDYAVGWRHHGTITVDCDKIMDQSVVTITVVNKQDLECYVWSTETTYFTAGGGQRHFRVSWSVGKNPPPDLTGNTATTLLVNYSIM